MDETRDQLEYAVYWAEYAPTFQERKYWADITTELRDDMEEERKHREHLANFHEIFCIEDI